jgi:hypothetical protein
VDNDFQVYILPDRFDPSGRSYKNFRVMVRRLGITTEGKNDIVKNNTHYKSVETKGTINHKTYVEASEAAQELYGKLRERYG